MKELREENIKIDDDFSILLFDDYYENKNKRINKEINISIFDSEKKNVENYKLLNEEEEILLCKEEVIKGIKSKKEDEEANIKIKELFNGEDSNSFYYLNKKEIKKNLFKNITGLEDDDGDGNLIDNHDRVEMEKLYKEVQLKHPRKIINGKFKRYSFFSWSGFFCCNKSDYLSLGQGYTTYFNTIKLLIIFFLIISLINIYLMKLFSEFTSVYNFKDDSLLKTTLGNTIIRYFNTTSIIINKNENYSSTNISLDCGENYIDDIIFLIWLYDTPQKFYYIGQPLKDLSVIHKNIFSNIYKRYVIPRDISYLNHFIFNKATDCKYKNNCMFDLGSSYNKDFDKEESNRTDIFYYSCITKINFLKNNYDKKEAHLYYNVVITTLVILFILILFYFVYKKAVSRDNKEYQKKKLFINNFTLVLHKLKIISDDYNQELNDLISFLNDIIKNNMHLLLPLSNLINNGELIDFNVFDISISNVNEKKIEIFKKIKSLQKKIEDIKNDEDSIKSKVKKNIRNAFHSMHNIVINLVEKEEENDINEDNIINDNISLESNDEEDNLEKKKKIERKKTQIKENKNNITIEITKLHEEYNLKNYVDIYITFRNQSIPNLLYYIYNKSKITRLFYYIFCQSAKIKKYYYKNQWLNFERANENPNDVIWENCYISSTKKFGRRSLSSLISSFLILLTTITFILIKVIFKNENESNEEKKLPSNNYSKYITIFLTLLTQIINLSSSFLLSKLTKFEKYSTKSKEIFSDISKYYLLNFLLSMTLYFKNIDTLIFSYFDLEDYFIQNKVTIVNMKWTMLTSQLSPIFFYCWNLLKRFIDSKYNNGKTTELKNKAKYENLYVGPEFPFGNRYAKILVNLSICFIFGTNCPVIFFFFVCFLIVTFIVDKYLIINYYKKPRFYGRFLSKKILNYFYFSIILYLYGLTYNCSNPYLFNNNLFKGKFWYSYESFINLLQSLYYFLNPFTAIYYIYCKITENKITEIFYYNLSPDLLIHFFIFILLFINPTSLIQKKLTPKNKFLLSFNVSPVEIGTLYSLEELKKYYDIKKLQLFDLIIDCNNYGKIKDNYSHIINNYMNVIKYLKQNIDDKSKEQKNLIDTHSEKYEDEYYPLKDESLRENRQTHLCGDISYNQSFIPKYEIYNNYNLIKNI